jgi:hypothetical protein
MDFPLQHSGQVKDHSSFVPGRFDMRDWLNPRDPS